MRTVRQPPRLTSQPQPSDRIRQLAAHVLRLGQRGWADPETFIVAKEQIAVELRALAWELGQ
jgi:hypothetical protein